MLESAERSLSSLPTNHNQEERVEQEMDSDEETIIYFHDESVQAYAEIMDAQSVRTVSDCESDTTVSRERGNHFLFEVEESTCDSSHSDSCENHSASCENWSGSGSDDDCNVTENSESFSGISDLVYSSSSRCSSSNTSSSSESFVGRKASKRSKRLLSYSDTETVDRKKRVVEYCFSTHSVKRETHSPVGELKIDVQDREDVKGEAKCNTPSPHRNGYHYDVEAAGEQGRFERAEVDFYWRRHRTFMRQVLAKQEEEQGLDEFGWEMDKLQPDSTFK